MSEEIEYETVTLKVPKQVMDFLRTNEEKPIEYLEISILHVVRSDIDGGAFDNPPIEKLINSILT